MLFKGSKMKNFKYEIVDKNKIYYGQERSDFIGVFGTKYHMSSVLLKLDSYDIEYVIKDIVLKENEFIFRYSNDKTVISKITPLAKVNVSKGLIYFLSDYNNNNDDIVVFDTKGIQLTFLVLKEDYNQYMIDCINHLRVCKEKTIEYCNEIGVNYTNF